MTAGLTNPAHGGGSDLAWGALATPVGEVSVACGPHGLARVSIGRHPQRPAPPGAGPGERPGTGGQTAPPDGAAGGPGGAQAVLARALAELAEYFSGRRRVFAVPVDWSTTSGTRRRVLSALHASVAYGETITYGQLARRAALATDGPVPPARAVGRIMGSNPFPVIVPCHRVVAGDRLGGYSGGTGPEVKRWLLIFEGAIPATLDWDPAGPAGTR